MTGKQKMAQVVKHFEEILKLYPDNCVGLDIHKIDKEDVSTRIWDKPKKKVDRGGMRKYLVFRRKPALGRSLSFDITLFT